jgi:hypothetical protein
MVKNLPKKIHHSSFILNTSQKGQALIILLLIMVVGLTVGLSIATRTITDLRISTQTEESQKAFSAAEAGIEDALRRELSGGLTVTGTFGTGATQSTYTTTVASISGATFVVDKPVEKDDVAQICIKVATICPTASVPTSVNIYWVKQGGELPASLEIAQVYETGGNFQIAKDSFNDPTMTPLPSNGFRNDPSHGSFTLPGGGPTFSNKVTITLSSEPRILRIRPFYNATTIAVEVALPVGTTLPTQSYKITSTGTTGQITRKIEVTKSLDALPPIFDYVLYSGTGDIKKQ